MDAKAAALVTDTAAKLRDVLDNKAAFIAGLSKGDGSGPALPAPIPFTTFQKLEKVTGAHSVLPTYSLRLILLGFADLVFSGVRPRIHGGCHP